MFLWKIHETYIHSYHGVCWEVHQVAQVGGLKWANVKFIRLPKNAERQSVERKDY